MFRVDHKTGLRWAKTHKLTSVRTLLTHAGFPLDTAAPSGTDVFIYEATPTWPREVGWGRSRRCSWHAGVTVCPVSSRVAAGARARDFQGPRPDPEEGSEGGLGAEPVRVDPGGEQQCCGGVWADSAAVWHGWRGSVPTGDLGGRVGGSRESRSAQLRPVAAGCTQQHNGFVRHLRSRRSASGGFRTRT